MAAADDEAKALAALKIQARGRGMITRKQDRSTLAQSSSPNRKEECATASPPPLPLCNV